jgi:hypothetical protein
MQEAANKVGEVTGGKLDVLIANAGGVGGSVMKVPGDWSVSYPLPKLAQAEYKTGSRNPKKRKLTWMILYLYLSNSLAFAINADSHSLT